MPAGQPPKRADTDRLERGEPLPSRTDTFRSMQTPPKTAWGESEETREEVSQQTSTSLGGVAILRAVVKGLNFVHKLKGVAADAAETREERRAEPLKGYPSLAEFLGSDERYLIFRRFSQLQTRLILEKQDDIRLLEEELDDMDRDEREKALMAMPREEREKVLKMTKEEKEKASAGKHCRYLTQRGGQDPQELEKRRDFFRRAEQEYKQYAELLTAVQTLVNFHKPASYEWHRVNKYTETTKPLVAEELEYIKYRGDLVALRGTRKNAALSAFLEAVFQGAKNLKVLNSSEKSSSALQPWLRGNAQAERIASWCSFIFLMLLMPLLFVVPIYALDRTAQHIGQSIGVLLAFALAFTIVLITITEARRHEVLGTAAAYLAVLVVFFGSNRKAE